MCPRDRVRYTKVNRRAKFTCQTLPRSTGLRCGPVGCKPVLDGIHLYVSLTLLPMVHCDSAERFIGKKS